MIYKTFHLRGLDPASSRADSRQGNHGQDCAIPTTAASEVVSGVFSGIKRKPTPKFIGWGMQATAKGYGQDPQHLTLLCKESPLTSLKGLQTLRSPPYPEAPHALQLENFP